MDAITPRCGRRPPLALTKNRLPRRSASKGPGYLYAMAFTSGTVTVIKAGSTGDRDVEAYLKRTYKQRLEPFVLRYLGNVPVITAYAIYGDAVHMGISEDRLFEALDARCPNSHTGNEIFWDRDSPNTFSMDFLYRAMRDTLISTSRTVQEHCPGLKPSLKIVDLESEMGAPNLSPPRSSVPTQKRSASSLAGDEGCDGDGPVGPAKKVCTDLLDDWLAGPHARSLGIKDLDLKLRTDLKLLGPDLSFFLDTELPRRLGRVEERIRNPAGYLTAALKGFFRELDERKRLVEELSPARKSRIESLETILPIKLDYLVKSELAKLPKPAFEECMRQLKSNWSNMLAANELPDVPMRHIMSYVGQCRKRDQAGASVRLPSSSLLGNGSDSPPDDTRTSLREENTASPVNAPSTRALPALLQAFFSVPDIASLLDRSVSSTGDVLLAELARMSRDMSRCAKVESVLKILHQTLGTRHPMYRVLEASLNGDTIDPSQAYHSLAYLLSDLTGGLTESNDSCLCLKGSGETTKVWQVEVARGVSAEHIATQVGTLTAAPQVLTVAIPPALSRVGIQGNIPEEVQLTTAGGGCATFRLRSIVGLENGRHCAVVRSQLGWARCDMDSIKILNVLPADTIACLVFYDRQ